MKYKIQSKQKSDILSIKLQSDDTIYCQIGSIINHSSRITKSTKSANSILNLSLSLKSYPITEISGPGVVKLSGPFIGEIKSITPTENIKIQSAAYVSSPDDYNIEVNKDMFTNETIQAIEITHEETVNEPIFISGFGGVSTTKLNDEILNISEDYLIGFESSIDIKKRKNTKGLKDNLYDSYNTPDLQLKGSGNVYYHSNSLSRFKRLFDRIDAY